MTVSLDVPQGWIVQLFIIYFTYTALFFIRKSYRNKKELRKQFIVAFLLLLLALIGEFTGINLKLWTYYPDNWPITVWIGYFGIGLIAYQLVKLVDELTS